MASLTRSALLALVAVLLVVGALVAFSAIRDQAPVGPPVAIPSTPSPSATPQPTAAPTTGPLRPVHVYFARIAMPPADATISVAGVPPDRPEGRILQRIGALQSNVRPGDVPTGATNPVAALKGRPQQTSAGTTQATLGTSARVDGDVATVEFDLGDWGVRSLDDARALVQQLVYVITDEPGVRRAKVVEKGKDHAVILAGATGGGYTWKDPLAREDVFGYVRVGVTKPFQGFGEQGSTVKLSTSYTVDEPAPGLLRFVIDVQGLPRQHYPDFSAVMYGGGTQMPNAKSEIEVTVLGGEDVTTTAQTLDRTPLRSVAVGKPNTFKSQTYRLGLDDQRPWRAVVLFDPTRIVIDVGGPPLGISDGQENTVVYSPVANAEVGRTFRLMGVVRAFEATFAWRVRSASGAEVARGTGMANIGTSPVWGGYGLDISLPASATGAVTLEVFQGSPKDGSEIDMAKVPLLIR